MIGRTLSDRYLVREVIGEGGMAVVYRALDQRLGREVAVKVLRDQYARDPEFLRRFEQEAQAVASLNHPHIAAVYDVGTDGDVHYIVMELLPSRNLRDILQTQRPLPPERAVEIVAQVARALQHAHERGLIHRDVKPQNILFTSDGQVKVTDFGIARALGGAGATETGTVLGSVHYMSPEQVSGAPVGPPSDIYSLGVVLYEMLTGQRPYEGSTAIETAQRHLRGDFIPPQRLQPHLPAGLDLVVRKAMARQPSSRFASAREMEQAVRASVGGAPEDTAVTQVFRPTSGRPSAYGEEGTPVPSYRQVTLPEPPRPKPWFWAVFALVLVVATIGLVLGIMAPDMFTRGGRREFSLPGVVGLPMSEAQARLLEAGVRPESITWAQDHSSEYEAGHVIRQEPDAGTRVKADTPVTLVLSLGVRTSRVPPLQEMSLERARMELLQAGLKPGRTEEREDEKVPAGYVIESVPRAGLMVEEGSPVDLIVSKGPPTPPEPVVPPPSPEPSVQDLPKPSIAFGEPVPAGSDPDNPERRVVKVVITIPADSPIRNVRITQVPSDGEEEEILQQSLLAGETATQTVENEGPMEVQVYVDGELVIANSF